MKKSRINPVSKKQAIKNKLWREITLEKWAELGRKCQWCGSYTIDPDGHHIVRRSKGRVDTKENCYVVHRLCHSFITDNNVPVDIYKNQKDWEARNNAL